MIGVYETPPDVGKPIPHEGPRGIGELLARMAASGWSPVLEGDHIIALSSATGDANVTLEPGGQLELAARPVSSQRDLEQDIVEYEQSVRAHSRQLGIAWLGLGFRPWGALDDVPWMPKGRYCVMRDYLPTRGKLAHEMMKRTATVQVNLDFSDADDAAAKLRCAMSVTSLLTAMYANSPIVDGADSGYQSYRGHVWRFVDPDRCGLLPFAFEDGDVFRAYAEWALDVPMFFVYRGGYTPAGGMTFRRFMRDGFQGHRATMVDWELHLSTVFPEARVKRFIEVRGCDSGSRDLVLALGPLCRGILYDEDACAAATALTADLSMAERLDLIEDIARQGLSARIGNTGKDARSAARELLAIAGDGLSRTAPDEDSYLDPLREIVETGRTRADAVREAWVAAKGDPAALIPTFRRFV